MTSRVRTPRFYVYALKYPSGIVMYVGKGSGRRLKDQERRHRLAGVVLQAFEAEKDAFLYEREMIALHMPELNRHPGGTGGTKKPTRPVRRFQWQIEIEKVGSRVYVARELLKMGVRLAPEKMAMLAAVAHGSP